ncbi:hypothetical protein J6590_088470 [Homalodisca vitripennis]|nr:hypothetical protein J6590_088470 [Homalodisca vitripennis]
MEIQEEDFSSIAIPLTTSSSLNPTLEELKKHGANPKNKGVSFRSSAHFSDSGSVQIC